MPLCNNQRKYISANKGNTKVFVETGFLRGDGVASALEIGFDKVISIELHQEYIDASKSGFLKEIKSKKVELIQGDSKVKLKEVISKIDEPIFFYLDAHGHQKVAHDKTFISCPLKAELETIKERNNDKDIVLVDDVWYIRNHATNPGRAPWAGEITWIDFMSRLEGVFTESVIRQIPYDKLHPSAYDCEPVGLNYALSCAKKHE